MRNSIRALTERHIIVDHAALRKNAAGLKIFYIWRQGYIPDVKFSEAYISKL